MIKNIVVCLRYVGQCLLHYYEMGNRESLAKTSALQNPNRYKDIIISLSYVGQQFTFITVGREGDGVELVKAKQEW